MDKLVDFEKYKEDFKWDDIIHFPIPTLNYITKRTGKNILLDFDNELEAEGNILAITRTAKNYLFSNRVDLLEWEYSIAHNKQLLYEILDYVLEFINFAFITGDYRQVMEFRKDQGYSIALINAKNNILGAKKVMLKSVNFREGY